MAVISFRVPDEEYKYAKKLAELKGFDNLSTYMFRLLEEQMEIFEDEQMVREIEEDMEKHPEDYQNCISHEELVKELENEFKE